jgi:lipopolysaccharide export system protein LptA
MIPRARRLAGSALAAFVAFGCGTAALAAPRAPAPTPASAAPSASGSPAASLAPDLPAGTQTTTINGTRIETDLTNWNQQTGDFSMPHRVRFARPGTDGTADRATGNSKDGTITLYGHVVVHDSGGALQSLGGKTPAGAGAMPATLTCDKLAIDSKGKIYTATGNVHFSQDGRTGSADRGTLDRNSNVLHLEGNVVLSDSGSTMTGSSVTDNLTTKVVDMQGAPLILKQLSPGAKVADQVETDEAHYNQNSGDFTMPHKAKFSRPGTDAAGDHANGNTKRGTLTLEGNVVVHDSGNAPEANTEDSYSKGGPSTMSCDKLDVDAKSKLYTASGNVKFEQGTRKGSADFGVLDRTNQTLHLNGKVHLADGASNMSSDNVDYNLATKDVVARGAPIIITQPVPSREPHAAGSPTPKPKSKKFRLPF